MLLLPILVLNGILAIKCFSNSTNECLLLSVGRLVLSTQPPMEKLSQFLSAHLFPLLDQSRSKLNLLISQRLMNLLISVEVPGSGQFQGFHHLECTQLTVEKAHLTVGVPTTWTPTGILQVSFVHQLSIFLLDQNKFYLPIKKKWIIITFFYLRDNEKNVLAIFHIIKNDVTSILLYESLTKSCSDNTRANCCIDMRGWLSRGCGVAVGSIRIEQRTQRFP